MALRAVWDVLGWKIPRTVRLWFGRKARPEGARNLSPGFTLVHWEAFLSPTSRRLPFQICENLQILRIHVGDGPEGESITIPMGNLVAILGKTFRDFVATRFRGPDKQVNNM